MIALSEKRQARPALGEPADSFLGSERVGESHGYLRLALLTTCFWSAGEVLIRPGELRQILGDGRYSGTSRCSRARVQET
jgi:hypothetical protein